MPINLHKTLPTTPPTRYDECLEMELFKAHPRSQGDRQDEQQGCHHEGILAQQGAEKRIERVYPYKQEKCGEKTCYCEICRHVTLNMETMGNQSIQHYRNRREPFIMIDQGTNHHSERIAHGISQESCQRPDDCDIDDY